MLSGIPAWSAEEWTRVMLCVLLVMTAAGLATPGPASGTGHGRLGRWLLGLLLGAAALVRWGPGLGPPLGAVLVVIGALGALLRLRAGIRARRERAARADRVREFCESVSADLAAGLPVGSALEEAVAAWPELRPVGAAHRLGASVADALREVARLPGAEDLRLVGAAWQVSARSGAGLAAALNGLAEELRERADTRRVIRSELASARSTARLLGALPLLTLLLGSSLGNPLRFLVSTTPGLLCLAAGCGLMVAGLWWIERIAIAIETEA